MVVIRPRIDRIGKAVRAREWRRCKRSWNREGTGRSRTIYVLPARIIRIDGIIVDVGVEIDTRREAERVLGDKRTQ